MAHQRYSPFEIKDVTEILRIIRGRTAETELPQLLKCGHCLSGSIIGMTVGEPPDVEGPFMSAFEAKIDDAELEECCTAIAEYNAELQDDGVFGAGEKAIDPALIVALGEMLVMLLKFLRERRKQGS